MIVRVEVVPAMSEVTGKTGWSLRTNRNEPVGSRLLSVDPENDRSFPLVPDGEGIFVSKTDAQSAAFEWNMYLIWVSKKNKRTTKRGEG